MSDLASVPRTRRLVIVGNAGGTNVGQSLARAAGELGIEVDLKDSLQAFSGPAWRRRAYWHLGGHRPPRLRAFGQELLSGVVRARAEVVITTGHCPVAAPVVVALRRSGASCIHYSTDDPWNPSQRAGWFLR